MFKLDPKPTFQATVQITLPGGESLPLPVIFRHKTKTQLQAWLRDTSQGDMEMALDVIESVPDKGADQPLTAFLEQLFENYPAAALDVYLTYRRELTQSRVKN